MRNQQEKNTRNPIQTAAQQQNFSKRTHSQAFIPQNMNAPSKIQHREESYWKQHRLVFASNGQDAPYTRIGVIKDKEGTVVEEVVLFEEYMTRAIRKNVKIASYLNVDLKRPFYAENSGPILTAADLSMVIPAIVMATPSSVESFHKREEAHTSQYVMHKSHDNYPFLIRSSLVMPEPLVFETIEPSESSVVKSSKRPRLDKDSSMKTQDSLFQSPVFHSIFQPLESFQNLQSQLKGQACHTVKTFFTDRCESSDYLQNLQSEETDNIFKPY